jgi:hypothetical protein
MPSAPAMRHGEKEYRVAQVAFALTRNATRRLVSARRSRGETVMPTPAPDMRNARSLTVACTLAVAAIAASAAPGDVVVPAHRTKDGQWVPANVAPSSAKTDSARRPARVATASKRQSASTSEAASTRSEPLLPPLLVNAQEIRR